MESYASKEPLFCSILLSLGKDPKEEFHSHTIFGSPNNLSVLYRTTSSQLHLCLCLIRETCCNTDRDSSRCYVTVRGVYVIWVTGRPGDVTLSRETSRCAPQKRALTTRRRHRASSDINTRALAAARPSGFLKAQRHLRPPRVTPRFPSHLVNRHRRERRSRKRGNTRRLTTCGE